MKISSHPSALRSSTLGPQGQYVSTPTESETSSNRPPPRFANSSLPNKNPAFPFGNMRPDTRDESSLRPSAAQSRSEEHTSELQSQSNLVCRLLLEKKKTHDRRKAKPVPLHHL